MAAVGRGGDASDAATMYDRWAMLVRREDAMLDGKPPEAVFGAMTIAKLIADGIMSASASGFPTAEGAGKRSASGGASGSNTPHGNGAAGLPRVPSDVAAAAAEARGASAAAEARDGGASGSRRARARGRGQKDEEEGEGRAEDELAGLPPPSASSAVSSKSSPVAKKASAGATPVRNGVPAAGRLAFPGAGKPSMSEFSQDNEDDFFFDDEGENAGAEGGKRGTPFLSRVLMGGSKPRASDDDEGALSQGPAASAPLAYQGAPLPTQSSSGRPPPPPMAPPPPAPLVEVSGGRPKPQELQSPPSPLQNSQAPRSPGQRPLQLSAQVLTPAPAAQPRTPQPTTPQPTTPQRTSLNLANALPTSLAPSGWDETAPALGSKQAVNLGSFGSPYTPQRPGSASPEHQARYAEPSPPPIPTQAASSSLAAEPDLRAKVWCYRDPQGVTQGPFSTLEMRNWNTCGYFSPDLPIRYTESGSFYQLRELFPPPAVPFHSFPAHLAPSLPSSPAGAPKAIPQLQQQQLQQQLQQQHLQQQQQQLQQQENRSGLSRSEAARIARLAALVEDAGSASQLQQLHLQQQRGQQHQQQQQLQHAAAMAAQAQAAAQGAASSAAAQYTASLKSMLGLQHTSYLYEDPSSHAMAGPTLGVHSNANGNAASSLGLVPQATPHNHPSPHSVHAAYAAVAAAVAATQEGHHNADSIQARAMAAGGWPAGHAVAWEEQMRSPGPALAAAHAHYSAAVAAAMLPAMQQQHNRSLMSLLRASEHPSLASSPAGQELNAMAMRLDSSGHAARNPPSRCGGLDSGALLGLGLGMQGACSAGDLRAAAEAAASADARAKRPARRSKGAQPNEQQSPAPLPGQSQQPLRTNHATAPDLSPYFPGGWAPEAPPPAPKVNIKSAADFPTLGSKPGVEERVVLVDAQDDNGGGGFWERPARLVKVVSAASESAGGAEAAQSSTVGAPKSRPLVAEADRKSKIQELMRQCNLSLDEPVISFLLTLSSPADALDYLQAYHGDSADLRRFVEGLSERQLCATEKSAKKEEAKASKDAKEKESQDNGPKASRRRRGKGREVDPSLLGFTAAPVAGRLMSG